MTGLPDIATPLGRLTGGRISHDRQMAANRAICRACRGAREIGPRWRIGSNSPWGPAEAALASEASCPHCGADGGELLAVDGIEYCPSCSTEWVVGDYDWIRLSDVLAYRIDRDAGRVQYEEPNGWPGHGWDTLSLHRPVARP